MKITIINGTPDETWGDYEKSLATTVEKLSENHEVDIFDTRKLNITYCCGCFSCWVKTPGLCVFRDDMDRILKSQASAECVIYISPIKAGFITADTKKAMDRFIPTALPYIKSFNGECHHPNRYKAPKALGVVLLDDGNMDMEGVEMIYDYFDRVSINMHAERVIKLKVQVNEWEGLINEINRC